MVEEAGIVIVGAGQAGNELAFALRSKGYGGSLTLVGNEPYLPYRRPPLSKDFLSGQVEMPALYIKPESAYSKMEVRCLLGVGAMSIDRFARTVKLTDGNILPYRAMALTLGGTARRSDLPGAEKENVLYLRGLADALRLRECFAKARRIVIVGGGFIGLEIAAAACSANIETVLLEDGPRVLARVAAPELSAFYEREHRSRGVDVRTNVRVRALHGGRTVETVELSDGEQIPCDAVIFGIGLKPETRLAAESGLVVAGGIVVDQFARTSDPYIVAAGDCTETEHALYDRRLRLGSVPNAIEQARAAAATLMGESVAYDALPWFWSDQYDLKLQMAGLSEGYDTLVIRGDPFKRSFLAFYLRGRTIISVDAVNRPAEFMVAKKLIAQRVAPEPEALADENMSLKALLDLHSAPRSAISV